MTNFQEKLMNILWEHVETIGGLTTFEAAKEITELVKLSISEVYKKRHPLPGETPIEAVLLTSEILKAFEIGSYEKE